MISDAVAINRVSRIVGYKITKGNFQTVSPNLPQRIAVFGEANHANQGTLDLTPKQITSVKQAGTLYGYGSPIYHMIRILVPSNGGGAQCPVWVYPQAEAVGAKSKNLALTVTGTASDSGKHTLVIGGREIMEGLAYDVEIESGDTPTVIHQKISDVINSVLGCPFTAQSFGYDVAMSSKWNGATADELSITVNTNGKDLGLTYTVTNEQSAAGTPSVQAALDLFGNDWNTIVVNSYGSDSTTLDLLEQFNGIPDPENPTGRFVGTIMKPFIAIFGSTADDPSSVTDSRENEVTNALAPAPGSAGLSLEAAANMAVLFGNVSQNTPHLDVAGKAYPDMPTPKTIGSMADYNNRDTIVQKGCSTVDLVKEQYVIQDFVTTYHPAGETPPQFRYARNLMLDYNVRFSYYLLEQINVVDHTIAKDEDTVSASKVIKPKQWKQLVNGLADELAKRALIVDADFMKASIEVGLSTTNPDRLETFFKYKRSGFARILSTTAEAGFNFGVLN